MSSYTSAAQFFRLVRNFSQSQPDWAECVIYETKPDEQFDLTLVSQRVYGNRDQYLAVMAAAGIDSMEQELRPQRMKLPTATQLQAMKNQANLNDRVPQRLTDR